ncbi:MAG: hypothetical protein HeimC2_13810 [Candidatus Heimdallarchaeota archaeon LC_2]|nr:MAG: hypothetical protein HeimC2_13810 [Candidatus Heimdallarchaeota archaeon LC_2]
MPRIAIYFHMTTELIFQELMMHVNPSFGENNPKELSFNYDRSSITMIPTSEKVGEGRRREYFNIEVKYTKNIKEQHFVIYQDLSHGKIPSNYNVGDVENGISSERYDPHISKLEDINSNLEKIEIFGTEYPRHDRFNENFKSHLNAIWDEINDLLDNTLKLIKWRYKIFGDRETYYRPTLKFSVDNLTWHFMPISFMRSSFTEIDKKIDPKDIEKLFTNEISEPFSFEILRESYYLFNQGYLRSSLIMLVTALESGIKKYLTNVWDDVLKFFDSDETLSQSPPIHRILNEYISNLTNNLQFKLSESYFQQIQNTINTRNEIVHGMDRIIKFDNFLKYQKIVTEILYFLSYKSGNQWATSFYVKEKLLKTE